MVASVCDVDGASPAAECLDLVMPICSRGKEMEGEGDGNGKVRFPMSKQSPQIARAPPKHLSARRGAASAAGAAETNACSLREPVVL